MATRGKCTCDEGSPCRCGYDRNPDRTDVPRWATLAGAEVLVLGIANFFAYQQMLSTHNANAVTSVLCLGIAVFAVIFAVNSAVHSYLIVLYSDKDKVSIDVGFYYCSNAFGRLFGTLIGGFIYTYTVAEFGLSVCLWVAAAFLGVSTGIAVFLRPHEGAASVERGRTQEQIEHEGQARSERMRDVPVEQQHSTEVPMMPKEKEDEQDVVALA